MNFNIEKKIIKEKIRAFVEDEEYKSLRIFSVTIVGLLILKKLLKGDMKLIESKQDYLQNVLTSYRMRHVDILLKKYQEKRQEVKELIETKYRGNIYSPINSGSYAKHTAINSKFDLDIVVPFKKQSFETLEKLFDSVYEFLNSTYSEIALVRKQKVSIGIEFFEDNDGHTISLDIVPGRELNDNNYREDNKLNLYVNSQLGLLREKSYVQTNINAQIEHIKAKENERNIIRLLKIWKCANRKKYKSFLLELITIKAFTQKSISGNIWDQLKDVMCYIRDNVTSNGFTLKDPGNSNNNVIETLTENEREELSYEMNSILNNINDNENDIRIYFPINEDFEGGTQGGYGVKVGSSTLASVPPDTRFG